jgi:hypothetical protein
MAIKVYHIQKFSRKNVLSVIGLFISYGIVYMMGALGRVDHPSLQIQQIPSFSDHPTLQRQSKGFRAVWVYTKPSIVPLGKKYSQANQDKMVIALMNANEEQNRISKSGSGKQHFFVDLASYEPRVDSNTYLLEQNDWDGLCIEPGSIHWYPLASSRKCTIVGAFVGGAGRDDGKVVDVRFGGTPGHQGIVSKDFDNKGKADAKRNLVSISTVLK